MKIVKNSKIQHVSLQCTNWELVMRLYINHEISKSPPLCEKTL